MAAASMAAVPGSGTFVGGGLPGPVGGGVTPCPGGVCPMSWIIEVAGKALIPTAVIPAAVRNGGSARRVTTRVTRCANDVDMKVLGQPSTIGRGARMGAMRLPST